MGNDITVCIKIMPASKSEDIKKYVDMAISIIDK